MVNFRTSTRITAQLVGATGIDVTRENGIYTVSLDLSEFVDLPSVDSEDEDNTYLPFVQLIGDDAFYGKMSFANFAAQIGATLTSLYQPVDATLTALAGVTTAANKLIYATGADAFATTDLTAAGRAILDDADATAQRVTLGLVIGTDVQAFDAELTAFAGLTSAADKLPYFTGAGTAGVTDFSAFARTVLDDADAAAVRTTIGAGVGDAVGPASSTDNAAARFDSTTGKLLQNSALLIADTTGALSRSGGGGIIIQGTNTNDSAAAGDVGELLSSVIASGSAVSLTTGTAANVTSLSLTAGDWDVWGSGLWVPNAATTFSGIGIWISTTSAAFPTPPNNAQQFLTLTFTTGSQQMLSTGAARISVASTTTVYLSGYAAFAVNTMGLAGALYARRRR